VVFASTLFTRAVDPLLRQIAHDIGVDVKTAALLSTAYTFPYAIVQPALGTIGDFFGKTRLMNVSLAIVVTSTLICSVATDFSLLVAMRVIAGMVAGGIFPVGMALIGDLVPVNQRQVAIGRLLAVGLTGNLIGATISGVIGDFFGWRAVFFGIGSFGFAVAVTAFFVLRALPSATRKPFSMTAVAAGFQSVFGDPRAKVCFGSVFFEGIFIHGLFPYVVLLLVAGGEMHASYAGLIIGGFGLGGNIYSVIVAYVVQKLSERQMMLTGAALACIGLVLVSLNMQWYVQVAVFMLFGFGFYMLHSCIQLHVTDLSHTARGTALSMHSSSFYFGQAIGPIYYGFAFSHTGTTAPPLLGAAVILVIGFVCARLLRHRKVPTITAQ
jgi:predicted MFS family arabinose efflux permease